VNCGTFAEWIDDFMDFADFVCGINRTLLFPVAFSKSFQDDSIAYQKHRKERSEQQR